MLIRILLICFLLSSCAHRESIFNLEEKKSYLKDPITVNTAIRLAHAAYLKACVHHSDLGFNRCKKQADQHVKDDIIAIMDQ
jgi:uncharacterized protein involved in high-affinity Fe2+ transport